MRLYGVWVAQNEADVIGDTLEFLRGLGIYEKIFFFDLGSTDNTLEIAMEYRDLLHEPRRLEVPYSGGLRLDLIKEHRRFYEEGDWIAIIDSDELYADDIPAFIAQAEAEDAVRMETYQVGYYFTDLDLKSWEGGDRARPVKERLFHYVINWSEMRFYKYLPGAPGCIDLVGRLSTRRPLNRHYPYRSPEQIANKIRIRLENRRVGGNSQYQIYSGDWRDYVIDHRLLHRFDGTYRFGVPAGVNWKKYYNFWANDSAGWRSPVYNNTYIYWLMSHGFIPRWSPPELGLKVAGKVIQRLRGRHRQLH